MKQFIKLHLPFASAMAILFFTILFSIGACAQVAPITDLDFFQKSFSDISKLGLEQSVGALSIAGVIVQIVIRFLHAPISGSIFPKLNGFGKISVVYLLTLLAGIIALKSQGLDWGATLMHSQTLFAIQVAANEVFKHYMEAKKA